MLNIATGGGKSLPQMAANAFDLGICEHNLSYLINIKLLKSQKRGKLPSSSCHWLPWSRKLRMSARGWVATSPTSDSLFVSVGKTKYCSNSNRVLQRASQGYLGVVSDVGARWTRRQASSFCCSPVGWPGWFVINC